MKKFVCVFLLSIASIGRIAGVNSPSDFVASLEFTHYGKVPICEIVIQLYNTDSRVYLIKGDLDSIYGTCEVFEAYRNELIHYIEAMYCGTDVDDYTFYKKSEWVVSSTRDILTISLANGQEYRYILGDTNSKSIQLIDSHLVQYSESFRKLAERIYAIYNQMIYLFIKDVKYIAHPE